MKCFKNKFVIITLIVLTPCLLMVLNINYGRAGTELMLNKSYKEHISGYSDSQEYYIDAPEGNLRVKVSWDSLWEMDLNLTVSKNEDFSDIIGDSDSPKNKDEFVNFKLNKEMTIYIKVEAIEGSGFYRIVVSNNAPILMNALIISACIALGVLSVVSMHIMIRKGDVEIQNLKYKIEVDKPIPSTFNYLLKQYSAISNLNILNYDQNKSFETELKHKGIGYYTTTHHSYSSSGYGHTYRSTTPYVYTIRYNSEIKFNTKDGKTIIKMKLKSPKLFKRVKTFVYTLLGGAVFIGIFFAFMPFIGGFWYIGVLIMLLFALSMGAAMPRAVFKSYKRTAEDQFQLLVKKPIIAMQLGTKEAEKALQIAPVEKKMAKIKADARFCPFCGNTVPSGAQICESCGSELD